MASGVVIWPHFLINAWCKSQHMYIVHNPTHARHAPDYEIHRGRQVPYYESVGRGDAVARALVDAGFMLHAPQADAADTLTRVHTPRYLEFLHTAWPEWLSLDASNDKRQPLPSVWPTPCMRGDHAPAGFAARYGLHCMDNSSPLTAGTWDVARAGTDAALSAARPVGSGRGPALSATRPPGHHAGADHMGGYCFLNNAATAAQGLLDDGARRVAVLDVDYHHGNGTQDIFYRRSDVLVVNIHGDPRTEYPYFLDHADETGAAEGQGFNLNLPLPAGASAARWFAALEEGCLRIEQHRADALVISLGLDTFIDDPISAFRLESNDFIRLGQRLKALQLPSVFILEGGYALDALGINTVNVVKGFCD